MYQNTYCSREVRLDLSACVLLAPTATFSLLTSDVRRDHLRMRHKAASSITGPQQWVWACAWRVGFLLVLAPSAPRTRDSQSSPCETSHVAQGWVGVQKALSGQETSVALAPRASRDPHGTDRQP